ncbi:MAG: hypothetical protein MJE68_13750, partial [Proteobacteria bacterium]|nr:hypothetical protein [Pseudomonadota bacterium]
MDLQVATWVTITVVDATRSDDISDFGDNPTVVNDGSGGMKWQTVAQAEIILGTFNNSRFRLVKNRDDTVTLTWDPVENAGGYYVMRLPSNN